MIKWIFSIIWSQRLWIDKEAGKKYTVIKVKGWRTAVLDSWTGSRSTNTFCLFSWD